MHEAVSECAFVFVRECREKSSFYSNFIPPPAQPPGAGVPPMRRAMQFIWAVAQPPSSTRHSRWFRHLPKPLHVEPQLPSKRHCVPAAKASQSSPQGPHDYRCPARRGTVHIIFPGLHSRLSSTMKYSEHVLSLGLSDVSKRLEILVFSMSSTPSTRFR